MKVIEPGNDVNLAILQTHDPRLAEVGLLQEGEQGGRWVWLVTRQPTMLVASSSCSAAAENSVDTRQWRARARARMEATAVTDTGSSTTVTLVLAGATLASRLEMELTRLRRHL